MSQTDSPESATHYSDKHNVLETLEQVVDEANEGDEGVVRIYSTPQIPMVALTEDDIENRNLWEPIDYVDDQICKIEWRKTQFGGTLLELSFHESSVDRTLEFMPAGTGAIAPQQATSPVDLGPKLKTALRPFVREHDAAFTFKGVQAGSMASGGHYTDFEYEYSIDCVSL